MKFTDELSEARVADQPEAAREGAAAPGRDGCRREFTRLQNWNHAPFTYPNPEAAGSSVLTAPC
jgi:hypothetical protein